MSAPVAVNTADGTCWTRRGEKRDGEALYAPEGVCNCPPFVMATLAELAEHGIVGSADALPMPVREEPQALSVERLAEIAARAAAATPGPWCTDAWEIYQGTEYEPGLSMWIGETCRGTTTPVQDRADAAFVAAARTDVPDLLADSERLRAALRDATEQIARLESDLGGATARVAELEERLAEYERPVDEDPIRYALTEQADAEVFVPRTEREHWVAIADALNAAHTAGMPVGIDLDGTLTDRNAWSVVWDRKAERWTVAGYEGGDVR